VRRNELPSEERAALEALVETVIGAAYEVSNVLGAGFLEKIYERALIEELGLRSLRVKAQAPFPVAYKGKPRCASSLFLSFQSDCQSGLFRELAGHFRSPVEFPAEAVEQLSDEPYVRDVVEILFQSR